MSHPNVGPNQPYQGYGQPYPTPASPYLGPPPHVPQYQSGRRIAQIFSALMGLTVIATIVQNVLMWRSYDGVKRLVFGLLSTDEVDGALESIAGTGPALNLVGLFGISAGVLFLVWLTRARENTAALPSYRGAFRHRRTPGWVIACWICPIVQFWYPLNVVQDVVRASEPSDQASETGQTRRLLYGWWAAWTGFWVIVVGGSSVSLISFVVWVVRLVNRVDAAEASDSYVDIYDLQSFLVRAALVTNIGATVATVLLLAAGVAMAILMLRVSKWQDSRMAGPMVSGPPPPPQYAPRPQQSFPSYGPRSPWQG